MTDSRRPVLAWALLWALMVAAAGAFLAWRLPSATLESSVFALLPDREEDPLARQAGSALRKELENRFLVLLTHPDPARAAAAADAYAARISKASGVQSAVSVLPEDGMERLKAFYGPHRFALLTGEDRRMLAGNPEGSLEAFRRRLFSPPMLQGITSFAEDPFGTWGKWLTERDQAASAFTLSEGRLTVGISDRSGVAVLGTLGPRGRGMAAQQALAADFAASAGAAAAAASGETAPSAAEERPAANGKARDGNADLRVLRAGFVFHELEAARQAHREMTTIGTVSAAMLLLMMLAAFRGPRPALLALLSVSVGALAGATALLLVDGGRIHLIAMVFGSTLLGVAEDYGMLFLSGLYEPPPWDGRRRLRTIFRSILFGLGTSVLGYLALFFVPIPGLKQIGIFSITGLIAAWITVALWFPYLAKGLKPAGEGARRAAVSMADRWPSLGRQTWAGWALLGILAVSLAGISRLRVDDDVRLLYARDPVLHSEQEQVSAILRQTAGGRHFLVRGASVQEALEREENLRSALAALDPEGPLALNAGVTSWIPSLARQAADSGLYHAVLSGPSRLPEKLEAELEAPGYADSLRRIVAAHSRPLEPEAWLASPLSLPFRHLLHPGEGKGAATVLPLPRHAPDPARLAAAAASVPGVALVDQVEQVSETLATLRRHVVWVLLAGGCIVTLALAFLFRRRAPAALAPAALGVAAGLGGLGWSGQALNLFGLLALALIMGMGVHYGIFMHESTERRRPAALVAVNLGAATNLIAFGMLVFSTTPALKAFGLVLAAGLGTAWLTAPVFAPFLAPAAPASTGAEKTSLDKGPLHAP